MEVYILHRKINDEDRFRVFTTRFTGEISLGQLQKQATTGKLDGFWQREQLKNLELFTEVNALQSMTLESFSNWADQRSLLKMWCGRNTDIRNKLSELPHPAVVEAQGAAAPAPEPKTRAGFTQEPAPTTAPISMSAEIGGIDYSAPMWQEKPKPKSKSNHSPEI